MVITVCQARPRLMLEVAVRRRLEGGEALEEREAPLGPMCYGACAADRLISPLAMHEENSLWPPSWGARRSVL